MRPVPTTPTRTGSPGMAVGLGGGRHGCDGTGERQERAGGGPSVERPMRRSTRGFTLRPTMRPVRQVQSPLLVGRDELLDPCRPRDRERGGRPGPRAAARRRGGHRQDAPAVRDRARKAEAAGFRVAYGALSPHDRHVLARVVFDMARGMRSRPAFGTLGAELLAVRGGRGADTLGVAPDARARGRGPDRRPDRRAHAAGLRRPAVGGRAQPRGDRRARAAGRRSGRCSLRRRLPRSTSCPRIGPPRVARAAAQPAPRRGGPARRSPTTRRRSW